MAASHRASVPGFGPKQAVGLVLLAACCAVVLHTRVYKQFDHVRAKIVTAEQSPIDGLLVVPLDPTRLVGASTSVVLRLANRSPDTRTVRITIGTTPIDRVILRPGQTSRVDLGVAVRWDADISDRMVLRGNGTGWVLEYLELANTHGFNSGWFSFLVVPDDVVPTDRPPKDTAVFIFLVLLGLPLALRPLHGEGPGHSAALGVRATVLCFLSVVLVLPVLAPYKVLLSVPTFWLCVATVYGSPFASRVAGSFATVLVGRGVLWRWVHGPAFRFGRDLAFWPVAAARCLAASRRRVLVGAIGAIVAFAVVLSWLVPALRSTPPTYPSGDQALLEIYTLHASHGDLSVGAYSQKQWNHPGPAYFYVLAPLHVLTGHEFSLRWTVLLLNLVSAVAAVVLLTRYGGWPFGLGVMAALSIYFLRPSPGPFLGFGSLLSSAWNPHAPMLPLAVLLVLCARLGSGNISTLPWIVLVASFVTQTHIALIPCTAAVTVTAALLYAAKRRFLGRYPAVARTDPTGQPAAFWICAAIWAFALMWYLPLLEQVQAGPGGNLAHIVGYFLADSTFETPTMATAFIALSYALWTAIEFGARIPYGGSVPSPTDFDLSAIVWSVLQLVLLAAGGLWAALTRRAFPTALCLVGLVAVGAAFWSITRVDGPLRAYLVFWISICGVINTAALVGLVVDWAWGALPLHNVRIASVAGPVTVAVFGTVLAAHGTSVLHDNHQRFLDGTGYLRAERQRSRALFAAVEEDLRRHHRSRPLIRIHRQWPEAAGVALQLHKAGVPLAIQDRSLFMFTEAFMATGVEDVELLFTDLEPDDSETPPYRLVAHEGVTFVYARDLPAPR